MAENENIEVNPTIELEDRVDMGSTASEYNAEAWAVGQRGGVDVDENDQTYHNNSKYYAQQASGAGASAEAAAQSAAAAEASKKNAEAWANGTKDGTAVPDTDQLPPGIYSYGYTAVTDPVYDEGKIVNGSGVCTPSFDKTIRIYDTSARV